MEIRESSFWKFFRSVRLTIGILLILALMALVGTLVPQGEEAAKVIPRWDPRLVNFLWKTGAFDLYHSALFRVLLLGLTVNLIVCSLDRLPKSLGLFRHSPELSREEPFVSPYSIIQTRGFQEGSAAGLLKKALSLFGGRPRIEVREERIVALSEYGRLSYFGFYLVHISILVILVGGLIGSIFGYEGYVNIVEGESIRKISLRGQDLELDLGFEVRCNRFTVDFYPNGTPKEYRSHVSILVDGKEVLKEDILVNHPLEFNGFRFYQASYGKIPYDATIRVMEGDRPVGEYEVGFGKGPVEIGGIRVELLDMRSDMLGKLGPALLLKISNPGRFEREIWVFQNPKALMMLPEQMRKSERFDLSSISPLRPEIAEIKEKYYTGLQVAKDPGVNVVWAGFILMIIGFIVTFFYPHRVLLVRWDVKENEIRIIGRTNKDWAGLENRLERVISFLKREAGKKE